MKKETLFPSQPGVNWRKEKALRMISEGYSCSEVRIALELSERTLSAWLKAGLPAGEPELDQLSLVDGLSERERLAMQPKRGRRKSE